MYKVIKYFTDIQDGGHAYKVGDVFPHDGKAVSDARIAQLAGSKNRQGAPLIKAVAEEKQLNDNESLNSATTPVQSVMAEQEAPRPKKSAGAGTKAVKKPRKKDD